MQLVRDAAHALRVIRKTPGLTTVIVLTLALGIGANTAIFSVVNAVLFQPFPFGDSDRLVVTWEVMPAPNDGPMFLSPPNYVDWRDSNRSFEQLAAFAPVSYFLATDEATIRVDGARITSNLLETLRVTPLLGRGFQPADDGAGGPPVVLISHSLWQGRFGGDPSIVGRSVDIDGVAREIVGVMGPDFDFPPPIDLEGNTLPADNDVWVPFPDDMASGQRDAHFVTGIGRLAEGATVASADADLNAIAAQIAREYPASNEGWSARVVPMNDVVLGNLRPALLVLLAAVTAVLLIACVNVANLMLSRATGRQKEFAIKAALGARRPRLLSQAIVESQVLALIGGAAGILFAWVGTRVLIRIAPGNVPRLDQAGIDTPVILWALALSVVTGLLFGLAPAVRSFSPDLVHWLKEGGRSAIGDSQGRLRDTLVVVEVALSLLLLVGAGLLFRSFLELRGIDPGFRAEQVLTMRVTLPAGYQDPDARRNAFGEIEERIAALPGVEAAGFSVDLPLANDYQGTSLTIEGEPPPAEGTNLVHFSYVTPGWFEAMGIPITAGRAIDASDVADSEPAVIINAAAAREYFAGSDPVGRRIIFGGSRRIVGVVGDVRLESIADDAFPAMYVPYYQSPSGRGLTLVMRARTDAAALTDAVRAAVSEVDTGIPVSDVRTMDEVVSQALASPRFSSAVLVAFSLAALFLAAIGIYGVISYATSMRIREIGVRMALGARPGDAMTLVIGHAIRLALAGIAIGVAAALVFTRFLSSLLFGVRPTDPLTLVLVSLFLVAVAVLAGGIPAWKASRVDPLHALRYE